ncbi:PstC family ABC transporter permease [Kiritimatiella glycovorans]|nr:PstC family ABC transporter permease [Kiritimatiella glycovorans]
MAVHKSAQRDLTMSRRASRIQRLGRAVGEGFLFLVTSLSMLAVLFIFYYIARDAWPFIRQQGLAEFFGSGEWYPSSEEQPSYGAQAIFFGSAMVTLGSVVVAVPLGIAAAVCLSDVLPFVVRQYVKPVIEILAAIPSVAFGFFALVVFAPILQEQGGPLLALLCWIVFLPVALLGALVLGDVLADRVPGKNRGTRRTVLTSIFGVAGLGLLAWAGSALSGLEVTSGTNALNVSFILGMMALPTIVSVAEDALQATGRELREGSYALGATRAETLCRTIIPAAMSGIVAAVILGIMRVIGETMVVWMASGNTAKIPAPWYDFLEPVRTITASIAGDMGEAARGTMRFHVLFTLALALLVISFVMNLLSQWVVNRQRRKLSGS